ncbi:DNA primase [Patescibacteria group bacterium]
MSDVEEVKSKINIVDFLGEYLRLEKAGNNWKAPCPFHNEKTASFMASEEKQMWHCFGCGKGGDIFTFLMDMEGLEFREALKILAEKAGVELSISAPGENGESSNDKNKIFDMLSLASRFYEKQLWEGSGKDIPLGYLKERGLNDETMKLFNLGFAPDGWNNIQEFLIQRGYEVSDILNSGLLVEKNQSSQGTGYKTNSYDRFRKRIMFPISDAMGRVVGFTSRALPGEDDQAKYINTPETQAYHKSTALYGIDKAKRFIKESDYVLLVEGNMDVIASAQSGINNVVAVSGTALTSEQLDILKRYTKNIKMFFDMDDAGQKAALRSAELAFQKDLNVSIVSIEDGKDAADLVKDNKDKFLKAVDDSVPAMEYFFKKTLKKYNRRDVSHKKIIASEILSIISNFSNDIEKHYWAKRLAESLEIGESIIIDSLGKTQNYSRNEEFQEDDVQVSSIGNPRRVDIIKEKIVGIIISNPEVWKKAVSEKKMELNNYLKDGSVKSVILDSGESSGFQFEKILDKVENGEYLRKLYFDNQQYRNEDIDNDAENWGILEEYLMELEKELRRNQRESITIAIKDAEMAGDKEAIVKLTQQLVEIPND